MKINIKYFDREFNITNYENKVMYSIAPDILENLLFPVNGPITEPSEIYYPTEKHQINKSGLLIIFSVP
jgi:hypothetical protein